jgi:hypothetical protein
MASILSSNKRSAARNPLTGAHMKLSLNTMLLGAALAMIGSQAQAAGPQLFLKGGTLGVGLGLSASVSESFGARLAFNTFNYSTDKTYNSNNYTGDLKFQSFELLGDYYLSEGWRVSAGGIYNANKVQLRLKPGPGSTYSLNGIAYPITSASAEVRLGDNKLTPYVGLGYSSKPSSGSGLGFYMDLGATFQSPQSSISVVADPLILGDATFQANKLAEEKKLKDEVSKAKTYPVLSLGMTYTF